MTHILLFQIGLALQTAPPGPPLSVSPQGPHRYVVTVETFDGNLLEEVDDAVAAEARKTCGPRRIVQGERHYKREKGSTAGSTQIEEYRKGFRCAADEAAFPRAPDGWAATAQDDTDVRRVFAAYYAHRDAGDAEAAFGMFEAGALADRDGWIAKIGRQRQRFGAGTRRITGVKWQVNPRGAGHPGAFALIAFDGNYPALHFLCGMLVLHRRGRGDYRIVWEDAGFYPRDGDKPYPGDLAQVKIDECPH